jgi:hypothetical protein
MFAGRMFKQCGWCSGAWEPPLFWRGRLQETERAIRDMQRSLRVAFIIPAWVVQLCTMHELLELNFPALPSELTTAVFEFVDGLPTSVQVDIKHKVQRIMGGWTH